MNLKNLQVEELTKYQSLLVQALKDVHKEQQERGVMSSNVLGLPSCYLGSTVKDLLISATSGDISLCIDAVEWTRWYLNLESRKREERRQKEAAKPAIIEQWKEMADRYLGELQKSAMDRGVPDCPYCQEKLTYRSRSQDGQENIWECKKCNRLIFRDVEKDAKTIGEALGSAK